MKFSLLVAMVPDDVENKAIELAKQEGAGGMTIVTGRGLANETRKTFFGLTFEGNQSVLLAVLEKRLSLRVLKSIQTLLVGEHHSKGLVFTLPIEHIGGLDLEQVAKFEQQIKSEI